MKKVIFIAVGLFCGMVFFSSCKTECDQLKINLAEVQSEIGKTNEEIAGLTTRQREEQRFKTQTGFDLANATGQLNAAKAHLADRQATQFWEFRTVEEKTAQVETAQQMVRMAQTGADEAQLADSEQQAELNSIQESIREKRTQLKSMADRKIEIEKERKELCPAEFAKVAH